VSEQNVLDPKVRRLIASAWGADEPPRVRRRSIRVYVLIELHEGVDRVEAFARRVAAAPQAAEVHQVSGRTDVLLVLHVRDMDEYAQFADTYLNGDASVCSQRALYVLRTSKSR